MRILGARMLIRDVYTYDVYVDISKIYMDISKV